MQQEINTLLQQLQKQKDFIVKLEQELAIAREAGAKREVELQECILKVSNEVAELSNKLEEVEEGRWEAVRETKAVQEENKLLQKQMAELRGLQAEVEVSQHSMRTLEPSVITINLIKFFLGLT